LKVLKGNFGKVYICDCFDGMKKLKDQSIELCLTDPPYNIGFKGKFSSKRRQYGEAGGDEDKKCYEDSMPNEEYSQFLRDLYHTTIRICQGLILTPGLANLWEWVKIKEPNYQLRGWFKPLDVCFRNFEPILMYGKINNIGKWGNTAMVIHLKTLEKVIHPCPKTYELWFKILQKINPSSVLDPLVGSGTTAQACEELGIKYVCFEKNETYIPDIQKRIKLGIKKYGLRSKPKRLMAVR